MLSWLHTSALCALVASTISLAACGSENTGQRSDPLGGNSGKCDPSLVCGQAITCVGGNEYPTTCGPSNCDKPLGPCAKDSDAGRAKCDQSLVCGAAITCVGGSEYPTTCGPSNCDKPLGPCAKDNDAKCDPSLVCGAAITCVNGLEYPTTCGADNCDKPLGACH